jgi:GT2 family glycosyltransferase
MGATEPPAESAFSVVVPTFNRPEVLATTLEALLALDAPRPLEVIVVDNAAEDSTREVVATVTRRAPFVRYVSEPEGGAATARNHGASLARGRWLLFCDDDIVPVQTDHLARHLRLHQAHPGSLGAGAWTFSPELRQALSANPFGRFRINLEEGFSGEIEGHPIGPDQMALQFISACNLSLERSLFTELEGFDDAFDFAGAEDQDLSIRARRAGHLLVYDRSIEVHHNDRWLSLREFGTREERSARTAVVLARNFPDEAGGRPLIVQNRPATRADPARVLVKKGVKRLLSTGAGLSAMHALAAAGERFNIADRGLGRIYSSTLGLRIFNGVRSELRRPHAPGQ